MGEQRKKRVSEKGVALIAITTALVLFAVITTEFNMNSTVDSIAAHNARDAMRLHFLERSGANLARLVIRVQSDIIDRHRDMFGDIQLADVLPMLGVWAAFGGGKEELNAFAEALGGFEGKALKGLGVAAGSFDVEMNTEDAKINMNCANGSQATQDTLRTMLQAMLFPTAFNTIFEEADAEGWRRTREEQVAALIDFIDRDRSRYGAPGTPEDYGYETLDERYLAKDNYLDTIGELKLVRGIDDRFWTLFGHNFTVYGDCKVNIGAVRDPMLIMTLIFLSAKNAEDPVVNDPNRLWMLAKHVADARNFGVYFDDLSAFSDFVKDPNGALTDLLAGQAASGQTPPAQAQEGQLVPIEGVELDADKLSQIARAGPRRTYRVEVTAQIGKPKERLLQKKLTAIWDTQNQNQNARDPARDAKGSWVFWKEE